jgi:hypothetical protein
MKAYSLSIGIVLFLGISSCYGDYYETQEALLDELFEHYNANIKPSHKVNVSLDLYMRAFFEVNLIKGFMDSQITFRQRWNDERLAFNNKPHFSDIQSLTISPDYLKKMWTPDTFFRNEIESHAFDNMSPNFYVRISPNGDVLFSRRLNLKTTCMPMWNQDSNIVKCPIEIASYGWQTKDIEYSWKDDSPLQVNKEGTFVANFKSEPEMFKTSTREITTSTGVYNSASATFVFKHVINPRMFCNA